MHHSAEQFDDRQGGGFMMGLMAGAAIGAGIALLFAPKEGTQTRRNLSDGAHRLGEQISRRSGTVRDTVRHATETANDLIARGKSAYRDASSHARETAEEGADRLDASVDRAADSAQRAVNRAQQHV